MVALFISLDKDFNRKLIWCLKGSFLIISVRCSEGFIHKGFSAASLLIWGYVLQFPLPFFLVSWSPGNFAMTFQRNFFFLPFFPDVFPFPNLLHILVSI